MMQNDLATYRLGPLKEAWALHCRRSGLNASEGLRRLLQSVLTRRTSKRNIDNPELIAISTDAREKLTIRLSRREIAEAEALASKLGLKSINRWLVSLVRANLYSEPVLSDQELQSLVDSTGELRAIGRNINQIARALNAGQDVESDRFALLDDLQRHIEAHTKQVTQILHKNVNRWRRSR